MTKDDIEYPRNIFSEIISENSPYAFYLFQWVPYQTEAKLRRLKLRHDVKTFDGRVELGIWPNGDKCGSFHDSEVEFIRISKDQGFHVWQDPAKIESEPEGEKNHICQFSRSIIDGETETCSCGAWR